MVVPLLVLYIIYNLRNVPSDRRNALSLMTIQNVYGQWVWVTLGICYLISELSSFQEPL